MKELEDAILRNIQSIAVGKDLFWTNPILVCKFQPLLDIVHPQMTHHTCPPARSQSFLKSDVNNGDGIIVYIGLLDLHRDVTTPVLVYGMEHFSHFVLIEFVIFLSPNRFFKESSPLLVLCFWRDNILGRYHLKLLPGGSILGQCKNVNNVYDQS